MSKRTLTDAPSEQPTTRQRIESEGNSTNRRPWFDWPNELPTVNECRRTPEYARLFDEKRIREMHQEVRHTHMSERASE